MIIREGISTKLRIKSGPAVVVKLSPDRYRPDSYLHLTQPCQPEIVATRHIGTTSGMLQKARP